MSREETLRDLPRLNVHGSSDKRSGLDLNSKEVRTIVAIAKEHNRQPGTFDYNYPQPFYSTFPEIEQEAYITIGSDAQKRVHNSSPL